MTSAPGTLSLKECAERLGVHYMTAYRYVRLGRLPASKVGAEWRVRESDLESLLAAAAHPIERGGADWSARLEDRLLAGDESGAWALVEAALASGVTPTGIHIDVLSPALVRIGDGWHRGVVSIAEEHRATSVAMKLVGRLGNRFARRGQRRGRVVIGTPHGERHALGVAIVADLLRGVGWDVVELGVDLPGDEFVTAVEKAAPVTVVAIGIGHVDSVAPGRELAASVRAAVVVPVVVGGAAIDSTVAAAIGADGWASDGRAAVEAVAALTA